LEYKNIKELESKIVKYNQTGKWRNEPKAIPEIKPKTADKIMAVTLLKYQKVTS
jgi:hypothetical protein